MELSQLETFLAVVAEKSFSRAAARLHRTQPAVSQVIRKLEEELGEPLFERASRDGTLTAAGEVLREYAERLLRLRNEASSALAEVKALERGKLTLAANEYTCLYLLPVLDAFREHCPQISILVQRSLASRIPDEVLGRTVEMGIVSYRPEDDQLGAIGVYSDDLVFIVPPEHALAREKNVRIRDLGAENFIAHNVPSPMRRRVEEAFASHKTPLNIGVELPSLEAIKRFVAGGNGVAFVPELTVQAEAMRGDVVIVDVPELAYARQLWLIYRRHGTPSYAAMAFRRVVRSLAREMGAPFLYDEKSGSASKKQMPETVR
ncbi:LysR family transcriptional regulator [Pseudacidobacterium ailaaui]|jgi:DNA-binding transcriptional LysR family regulator|uniref:LysR family transcriptional regulator n=1 Tax=Pseudacidobacterium ailaaui TaxID=1382359 RepID=UPI0005D1AA61|nr:LysR family transcriptional regulator [Pseudacidobacterium ailaaui]MBX6359574.1 LysR family transcriptional regulator [Pseudacidobacterium ailaaui]MCL6463223.1 LysR family transcriptional regulator [Pseudacidobacterium ailaaui]MDI3254673.1 LysR family transcriptional regulator [Bacillota bacterium]